MKKITIIILLIISIYGEEYNLDYKATKLAKTAHQYAGYAILGLVASNVYLGLQNEKMYNQENTELHRNIGSILITTAISSAIVGVYAHRDELFDFSDGITKEHIHALLGLSAVAFIVSNSSYELDEHKRNGILAGSLAISAFSVTLFEGDL